MSEEVTFIEPVLEEHMGGLTKLFGQAWWTKDRSCSDVARMLANSSLTGGYLDSTGQLVAFVRVLTDWTFKAIVMDLIVDEPLRRRGLARTLCERVLSDERLRGVPDIELYCHVDLIPYYESMGFAEPPLTHFMRLTRSYSE